MVPDQGDRSDKLQSIFRSQYRETNLKKVLQRPELDRTIVRAAAEDLLVAREPDALDGKLAMVADDAEQLVGVDTNHAAVRHCRRKRRAY